jgi:hypothetical protein
MGGFHSVQNFDAMAREQEMEPEVRRYWKDLMNLSVTDWHQHNGRSLIFNEDTRTMNGNFALYTNLDGRIWCGKLF